MCEAGAPKAWEGGGYRGPDWSGRAAAIGTEGTDICGVHLPVEVHGGESKYSNSDRMDQRRPVWLWHRSRPEVGRLPPEHDKGKEEADVAETG